MDSSRTLRVVVADPQPLFRYGLTQLIESSASLRVVGEAKDSTEAIATVRELRPDVLVLTIPDGGDAQPALQALDNLPADVRCIIVTSGPERAAEVTSVRVGCVLSRDSPGGRFLSCIRCVSEHQCWPVPKNTHLEQAAEPVPEAPKASRTRYRLTERESQIVAAIVDGASNKDIAAQFRIAEDTVKHHVSHIFDKVGVHSRLELAVFALHHRIV